MGKNSGESLRQRFSRRDLLKTAGVIGGGMIARSAMAATAESIPEKLPAGVKITSVQATMHNIPVHVPLLDRTMKRPIIFVEIKTDEGVTGYGLTAGAQRFGIKEFIDRELASFLKGKSPLETEALWHQMYSTFNPRSQTGVWSSAVSAVDIALWDIKGKHYKEPVWRLLGGAKKKVPAYITFGFWSLTDNSLWRWPVVTWMRGRTS